MRGLILYHQRCKAAAAAGEARGHFQRFAVDLSQAFADVDQAKRDQDRQLSGMASAVTTDIVMPVSISNWGAYALEAGLAILAGRAELLHDADTERRMLVDCVALEMAPSFARSRGRFAALVV